MSKKSDYVKNRYTELSEDERVDVINFLKEFEESSASKKTILKESFNGEFNKGLGPTSDFACSLCGK